ncbi:MAG: [FeFe] hydrogenase H-cluster radical SAM maturase HydE [Planctomycetia bacterium]|nr:[FeFe] hydrogenase H-cluster radical SAM maturase HydE [Planctomycetia bacterium]
MKHSEIVQWLRETDPARLARLWREADLARQRHVGGDIHLRGLIELSNHCVRLCGYCGLRAANAKVRRYRMTEDEILDCAHSAVELGYGTVVLQSGEDPGVDADWMTRVIRRIKAETPLAVTLSLGERSDDELAAWREAGADRYLLRFETSNRALYQRIHPPRNGARSDRLAILATLRRLGYEIGSGVMIGIPGQSYDDLARDIELFAAIGLDMIGVGPYLVHPETPLADPLEHPPLAEDRQVPNSELMTYKVVALARLACPRANIPATTALATLNSRTGRELGLERGANVIMPNLTPPEYRADYEIYPDKACITETAEDCGRCVQRRIESIGRTVGAGRGDSPSYVGRHDP